MSIAVCSGLVTIQWINLLCGQAFGFKFHCQKLNDLVTIEGTFCCMIYISWVDGYFVLSSILMSVLGIFALVLLKESQWVISNFNAGQSTLTNDCVASSQARNVKAP